MKSPVRRKKLDSGFIKNLPASLSKSLLIKLENLNKEDRLFDCDKLEAFANQRKHQASMLSPIGYVVVKKLVEQIGLEIHDLYGIEAGKPYPLMLPAGITQLVGLVMEFEEAKALN
ncbi:MAG: hypothetical protein A3C06_03735 [Candidatus Taylorbacteria bacterium RIFCSPHIGHO2_02_FULL_46_13]|uniref:Uncharacterized protein n=1 Tax=Candidatus Taylorbacteria bacterium RIFCSPHIGHO2_02_FULL_46_13 TaxID=1802312 RepID=A0A1G2MW15_9BACT|nr:MAG: hypothetical protein A3C06_03735 [Candidatus Taylorbacteria bacterium RIFCSPHIGHO2_02_FULL_46_13]